MNTNEFLVFVTNLAVIIQHKFLNKSSAPPPPAAPLPDAEKIRVIKFGFEHGPKVQQA
jgi:hypothetical protein